MKKTLLLLLVLFTFNIGYSQYRNNSNHRKHIKYINPFYSNGKNNNGLGVAFGYFFNDNFSTELNFNFSKFNYKSYKENILEVGTLAKYKVISPKYSSRLFRNFNVQIIGGFSMELIKNTSKTILIEPYPKYFYAVGGLEIEYTLNNIITLISSYKQNYALNGAEDKLGFYRYNLNLGVKFYFN